MYFLLTVLFTILPFVVYVVSVLLLRKYLPPKMKRRLSPLSLIFNLLSVAFIIVHCGLKLFDWYLPSSWLYLSVFICMVSGLLFYISGEEMQMQGKSYLGYTTRELIRWLYGGFYFLAIGVFTFFWFWLMLSLMGCSVTRQHYEDTNFKVVGGLVYRKYGFAERKVAELPPSKRDNPIRKVTRFGKFVRVDFDTDYLFKDSVTREDSVMVVRIR